MLPTLTGKEKEDRLPVLVTGVEIEKILSVPAIESGSRKDQAHAVYVYGCITDWNLTGKIKALCFDTTSSNTGKDKGATVILKKLLKEDVLHMACRHHIMEITLEKVFS